MLARARGDPRNTARETPKTECVQRCSTPVAGGEGGGFAGVAGDGLHDGLLQRMVKAQVVLGGKASVRAGSEEPSVLARAIHGQSARLEPLSEVLGSLGVSQGPVRWALERRLVESILLEEGLNGLSMLSGPAVARGGEGQVER